MNRIKIKTKAKEIIKNNKFNIWKPILLMFLLSFAVSFVIGLIFGEESTVGDTIIMAFSIAVIPVSYGTALYNLNLVRGKEFSLNNLKEFYPQFGRVVAISVLTGIFVGLWTMLLIIPGIIAAIGYAYVTYVAVDNKDLSVKEVLSKSKELMKGYKMDYFIFQLSFIGWALLTPFTFGLLYIWLVPYMTVANVLYYEELNKRD